MPVGAGVLVAAVDELPLPDEVQPDRYRLAPVAASTKATPIRMAGRCVMDTPPMRKILSNLRVVKAKARFDRLPLTGLYRQSHMRTFRVGTRGSPLARAQAEGVVAGLKAAGQDACLEIIVSTADQRPNAPIAALPDRGVFVKELDEALTSGRTDVSVHSMKDVPSERPPGIRFAAIPPREDPRDALVSFGNRPLEELEPGSTIGTGSPRRSAQIAALRADLRPVPVRGNVDTRIRKVREGEIAGAVLARAGLARLGRLGEIAQLFDLQEILPAVGQGFLGIECRADDAECAAALAPLNDADAHAAAVAERALMAALEGGCLAPLAAHAFVADGALQLQAAVFSLDGRRAVRAAGTGTPSDPESLGRNVAARLMAGGARDVLSSARRPLAGRRILVTRAKEQAGEFSALLTALGADVLEFPLIRIEPPVDPAPLREAVASLGSFEWVVFTSVNGVEGFVSEMDRRGVPRSALSSRRIAAIGPATAEALVERGLHADVVPPEFRAESLGESLTVAGVSGTSVLLARAQETRDALDRSLAAAGALVTAVAVYRTVAEETAGPAMIAELSTRPIAAITFASPSTVKAFCQAVRTAGGDPVALASTTRVAVIGPVTASAAREAGLAVTIEAPEFTLPALANALARHFAGELK